MKWIIFVLVMVVIILMVICYALLDIARDAEETTEIIYKAWRESKDE